MLLSENGRNINVLIVSERDESSHLNYVYKMWWTLVGALAKQETTPELLWLLQSDLAYPYNSAMAIAHQEMW